MFRLLKCLPTTFSGVQIRGFWDHHLISSPSLQAGKQNHGLNHFIRSRGGVVVEMIQNWLIAWICGFVLAGVHSYEYIQYIYTEYIYSGLFESSNFIHSYGGNWVKFGPYFLKLLCMLYEAVLSYATCHLRVSGLQGLIMWRWWVLHVPEPAKHKYWKCFCPQTVNCVCFLQTKFT